MKRSEVKRLIAKSVPQEVADEILKDLETANVLKFTEYGNSEINEIVDTFKDCFGTTKTTRYDRFAATRLLKTHGKTNVVTVIATLAQKQGDKYCPSVNNVSQLEEKWASIIRFLKNHYQAIQEIEL